MGDSEVLQVMEEKLECPGCLLKYVDPKLLQCGHVFCSHCVEELEESLTCPFCLQASADCTPAMHIAEPMQIFEAVKNGEPVTEQLLKDLKCWVCLKEYTEPKVLECSHVFCQQCLEPLVEDGSQFDCPRCRQTIFVAPASGVAGMESATLYVLAAELVSAAAAAFNI